MAGFGVQGCVLDMPEYEYEALDQSGKTMTGKIESSSANNALKSLIGDGLHVTGIKTPTVESVDPGLLTEKYGRIRRQAIPVASAIFGFFAGLILTFVIQKYTLNEPNEVIAIIGAVFGAIALYALSLPGLPMLARLGLILFLTLTAILAGLKIWLDPEL